MDNTKIFTALQHSAFYLHTEMNHMTPVIGEMITDFYNTWTALSSTDESDTVAQELTSFWFDYLSTARSRDALANPISSLPTADLAIVLAMLDATEGTVQEELLEWAYDCMPEALNITTPLQVAL